MYFYATFAHKKDFPDIPVSARASVGNRWHTQITVIPGGSNTKMWAGTEEVQVVQEPGICT